MDIIVITQCLHADPPLRLPDMISTAVYREIDKRIANRMVLDPTERKRIEIAVRENSKLRPTHDRAIMLWLEKKCESMGLNPIALDCSDPQLSLTARDREDHFVLQHVSTFTIRFRAALIQLLNRRMSKVMGWLDFNRTQDKFSLAFRLQKMAYLVFSSVKLDIFQKAVNLSWGTGLGKGRELTISLSKSKAFSSAAAFAKAPNQPSSRSNCLFMQLYRSKIGKMKPEALRSKLYRHPNGSGWCHQTLWNTRYTDSEGMDYGGLYRDCMSGVAKCMWMDEFPLFKRVPNGLAKHGVNQDTFMPNSDCKNERDLFIFAGQILGISIRTKGKFEVRFPPLFYKLLAGSPLTREDLATIDMSAYHDDSLNGILSSTTSKRRMSLEAFEASGGKLHISMFTSLDIDAERMQYHALGPCLFDSFLILIPNIFLTSINRTGVGNFVAKNIAGKTVELVPGGARKRVTFEKLLEFCDLYDQFRLHEFDTVVSYIQLGLASVVPLKPLRLFTPREFEELVVGKLEVDIEHWKNHTEYRAFWGSGRTPSKKGKWFWNIIESFTKEQQRDFIKFAWGRSRLPDRNDPEEWTMKLLKISMAKNTDNHLPEGHTCFFQFWSPEYSSQAQMKKQMLVAMTWGLDDLQLK